eukprot:2926367-Pyramimonas_sp.AAC.1
MATSGAEIAPGRSAMRELTLRPPLCYPALSPGPSILGDLEKLSTGMGRASDGQLRGGRVEAAASRRVPLGSAAVPEQGRAARR